MGATCFECSSRDLLEQDISSFFDLMLIRKTTHELFITQIKKNWKKGTISIEDWHKVVNALLGKSLDSLENENYIAFWNDVYRESNIMILSVIILFLCERNNVSMKQKFESLCLGIFKSAFKDNITISSDEINSSIKTTFLKEIISAYITLISTFALKYSSPIKDDKSNGKTQLELIYTKDNIDKYTDYLIADLEKKIDSKIRSNHVKIVKIPDFIDYDEFFEYYYDFLIDDKQVRHGLDKFSAKQ